MRHLSGFPAKFAEILIVVFLNFVLIITKTKILTNYLFSYLGKITCNYANPTSEAHGLYI
jgi:hypothetical protein